MLLFLLLSLLGPSLIHCQMYDTPEYPDTSNISDPKKPPNFIVILADDLGYNDLGVLGSPAIRTPNLDRLLNEGLRFNQFYAYPLCSPTRAALFTGRFPARAGVYTNYTYPLDAQFRVFYPTSVGCMLKTETTIPEYLRKSKHKYFTAMVGKWHLGHQPNIGCLPTYFGFDEFFGLPYSHEEGWPTPFIGEQWPPIPLYEGTNIIEQPVNLDTLTPRYNQRMLKYLDTLAKNKRPFFLHYAFEQPHFPLFASPPFQNKSLRGPYGDAVEEMDAMVGLLLDKLRKTGLDKNTLVYFGSDNGAWINPGIGLPTLPTFPLDGGYNGALRDGKGSTWEGGDRVVAAFWWPKTITPGTSMAVASIHDMLPTVLDFAGIKIPDSPILDGYSLVPLLTGKNTTSPYRFYYYYRESILMALRYGPWKCHYYTRSGFDADPPIFHDPCLLFQVEWNAAENIPMNTTLYPDLITLFNEEYARQVASVVFGPPEYNPQDITLMPCCKGSVTQEKIDDAHAQGLFNIAMWQYLGCVC